MSEFEELYNLYYKDVYYFVLKLADYRDHIAEEVTQESFYQAFISLPRFRGECSMKSWLCQIAKNTYYKYLKTHAKETYLEENLHQEQEEETVSIVVEKKQVATHIRKVIADLDERSQRIVEYRLFDEKSYKEIGELIGIREATAKVLFSRAKVKIRERLKEEYGYEI
ncbi:MAG: RNA polymerase sigma factor [Lachnospiraceae bacterium]|nr:RNA polymerase sigma factor [Lachnospiraceae bacterium]